eukprot:TRINITY_DN2057_c0_g1_i1.p1 TRINITY_DN2057_c0_g1~~TRINITY_DN2057_c0_g1_i1.p1  ORF type:complete len:332 (-),score=75.73 TRINITY_DN2057_c0_g1_i1:98-1093(-)
MSQIGNGAFFTETKVNAEPSFNEISQHSSGITQTSQSTLLLKKRKEMREVDEALQLMKEEYKARRYKCDQRQQDFLRKQQEMKDQIIRFEKFIQENDAKRQKAEIRYQMESRAIEQSTEKIAHLQQQASLQSAKKSELQHQLDGLRRYQIYLDNVVESSREFEETADLLNRHKTLVTAKESLTENVDEVSSESDNLRTTFTQYRSEASNRLLVENSKIHSQQQKLEGMKASVAKLEVDDGALTEYSNEKQRETNQVLLSIQNLHFRCTNVGLRKQRKRGGKDDISLSTLFDHLSGIEQRVKDLNDIYKGYLQQKRKQGASGSLETQASILR